ncbi:MAG: hypothetical protein V3T01_14920 [Myxococcota bacterium]
MAAIPGLTGTGPLDLRGNDGKIDSDTVFLLSPGINIIDVVTGRGVHFLIQNSNFVIDGPEAALALFRIPDDANLLIAQANILVGDGAASRAVPPLSSRSPGPSCGRVWGGWGWP